MGSSFIILVEVVDVVVDDDDCPAGSPPLFVVVDLVVDELDDETPGTPFPADDVDDARVVGVVAVDADIEVHTLAMKFCEAQASNEGRKTTSSYII